MKEIRQAARFRDWFAALRDEAARHRIESRVERLATGNPGTHRFLSRGLRELKIDVGPGYRVCYVDKGDQVIILLAGGDKSTQRTDISVATRLLRSMTESD